ncbi:MAG: LysM peptidoglycan-binding domain-containing protein [Planctomycetota bacterium]|nr:LysM peptidoglycan-binding domain-containing protein [Planctomycetota bacterium]
MSKLTQGAFVVLALLFVAFGGYYILIAPTPETVPVDGIWIEEVIENGAGSDGSGGVEALDITITGGGGTGVSAPLPNGEVFNSTPEAIGSVPPVAPVNPSLNLGATNVNPDSAVPVAPIAPIAPITPVLTDYVVKDGDTFSSIAKMWFGSEAKLNAIVAANPSVDPKRLKIGSTIKLPPKDGSGAVVQGGGAAIANSGTSSTDSTTTYTVVKGDTLSSISESVYGDSKRWSRIYDANKATIGSDPSKLKLGMKLQIPSKN